MKTDILIIGAGLSGITVANKLATQGKKVLLIEKRNHIGGNCYDYFDQNGILIHKYGPHIFHTSDDEVWQYLNQFTDFTTYQHRVTGFIDGQLISIPFNLDSLYKTISPKYAKKIEKSLLKFFNYGDKASINELQEKTKKEKDDNLSFIANYIYEKIFKNYTLKQWGISVEEINPEVLKRVPIFISKDDRYFQDKHQGMPKNGYTTMMNKMLDNKNIKVLLNTENKEIIKQIDYKKLIFTGPIDEFFDYKHGKLDYRKTLYKFEEYNQQSFQKNSVINYPNDYDWTRITEMKKFYPQSPTFQVNKTVICKEIPGIGEIDAYPVENETNNKILEKYKEEIKKLDNIYFLGRLANYKYFNMDQVVKNALISFNNIFI